MRLYNKRFITKNAEKKAREVQETRDAILWDVLPSQKLCRVKIQGSGEYITAHYPENWEQTPSWLKPGNAVKVMHTGGIRGWVEIVGHGQVVPTPLSGSAAPTPAPGPDAIITGCNLSQIPNIPQMAIMVSTGTFRISDIVHILDAIAMDESTIFEMGMGGEMGSVAAVSSIATASAIYFRNDLVVVGANSVVDIVKGANFSTVEIIPAMPSGHILIGKILVYPNMNKILTSDINKSFYSPTPKNITFSIADDDLAWGELSTAVVVNVIDQYGNAYAGAGAGFYITLAIISGNGAVSSVEEGSSATIIGQHTGATDHSDFIYTRGGADPGDHSPILQATIELDYAIQRTAHIVLRDVAGNEMM